MFHIRINKTVIRIITISLLFNVSQSCKAQEQEKEKWVIVSKKKEKLGDYSRKYNIPIERLRKQNPKIKSDQLKVGDTVFLVVVTKPSSIPLQGNLDYKERVIGNSGVFKSVIYKGKNYFVCEVNPHQYKIEIFNKLDSGGKTYDMSSIAKDKKDELVFSMNGGMFEEDFTPVGLFVAEGKVYKDINLRKNGRGNFYELPPNGVFVLDSNDNPFVIVSENYSTERFRTKLATQSGPMLVINGQFNNGFTKGSSNLNIRNGVGVNKKGHVLFIVSEDPVNFYDFSELFRDKLGCDNALYLDGVVSQYYAPAIQKALSSKYPLGVFLTVSKKFNGNAQQKADENKLKNNNKKVQL